MKPDLERAIRSWNREVDQETIKLIEAGTPPFDAMERAKKIVSARRYQRLAEEEGR